MSTLAQQASMSCVIKEQAALSQEPHSRCLGRNQLCRPQTQSWRELRNCLSRCEEYISSTKLSTQLLKRHLNLLRGTINCESRQYVEASSTSCITLIYLIACTSFCSRLISLHPCSNKIPKSSQPFIVEQVTLTESLYICVLIVLSFSS